MFPGGVCGNPRDRTAVAVDLRLRSAVAVAVRLRLGFSTVSGYQEPVLFLKNKNIQALTADTDRNSTRRY